MLPRSPNVDPVYKVIGLNVMMSCEAKFHVVRSALQNSVSILSVFFAHQVFYRSYVLRYIR